MSSKKATQFLQSCDTFVVLPPATSNGLIVFGKNSDRPASEVQEVVYVPAQDHAPGSSLSCTYIDIDQVPHTHAVVLSKPSWMWGAEMGSNEYGVCIGNEAVWTKLLGPQDEEEHLLGMDLLRLGLERGATAKEAMDVIAALLEQHGQGGPCSDTSTGFVYHNSFLLVDRREAWVLETAGKHWAAEQITSGFRNISNCLTIRTKIDAKSTGLIEYAQSSGLWNVSDGEFDFAPAFEEQGDSDCYRFEFGKKMLGKLSESGKFGLTDMFTVLRDERSGICMNNGTTGSQVSVLSPVDAQRPCCHWFTSTPDPSRSVFKPFIFTPNVRFSPHTKSPVFPDNEDPAKVKPRFQKLVDRRHNLYKLHQKLIMQDGRKSDMLAMLRDLEAKCVQETEEFLNNFSPESYQEMDDLFKDVVESEMKFYK